MIRHGRLRPRNQTASILAIAGTVGLLFAGTGCPPPTDNMNNNNNGGGGTPPPAAFGILNILANAAFSDDIQITVFYTVPSDVTDVLAFYRVLNAPANLGGIPIGIEELIVEDLPAGANRSFVFDSTDLRPGFYQLGVRTDDEEFVSTGTIEIQGQPEPLFLEPAEDTAVRADQEITVVIDIGDPQALARWRLFYVNADAEEIPEGQAAGGTLLGTRLAEGTGNTVNFVWDTGNVAPGSYRLGISATDTGFSIADAVSSGRADSIVTTYAGFTVTIETAPGQARPPTISLTTPNQTAFVGDVININFTAQTFEGNQFLVRVFYDFQDEEDVEEDVTIATITDPTVSSTDFDTAGLAPGVYAVGASVFDGLNNIVETSDAAAVLINVVGPGGTELAVSAPGTNRQVAQGTEVDIDWSTNVPAGTNRTFRVFARACTTCNSSDAGTGADIVIANNLPLNVRSATWDTSGRLGNFLLFVDMRLPEVVNPIQARAPGVVRVSILAPQFWVGSIGRGAASIRSGERFQGVNFQDNAGTFVNTVGDYNGDGQDEFIIGSRFGKPFFQNPDGIGIGEAYMIFGGDRRNQTRNLNTVALADLHGVTFTGPRTRSAAQSASDGLSAVRLIPDQDGDGLAELAFGFPFIDSRGHSKALFVDKDPVSELTLERPRQFLRGGLVFVASTNPNLSNPPPEFSDDPDLPFSMQPVVHLDLVGQNFTNTSIPCAFHWADIVSGDPNCMISTDMEFESWRPPATGFNRVLSGNLATQCRPFSLPIANHNSFLGEFELGSFAECYGAAGHIAVATGNQLLSCVPATGINPTPVLAGDQAAPFAIENIDDTRAGSDYYPLAGNAPQPPFGARIIGASPGTAGMEATTGDKLAGSIAVSGDFVMFSAPNRTPVVGEVAGTEAADLNDNGLAYMINMNNLWPNWNVTGTNPPAPFHFQIGLVNTATAERLPSHCGRDQLLELSPSPFRILGEPGHMIEIIEGIPDFNGDGREDFVVGAPLANNGDGAVYAAYRRDPLIEGDYVLARLSLMPADNERLAGLRINGRPGQAEGLGSVIMRSFVTTTTTGMVRNEGIDLNADGRDDLVLGNPGANTGRGEVIIVFATDDLITPQGGMDLNTLLAADDADGNPRAIRIIGAATGNQFGFNVSAAGDFDGDGRMDLAVAAPMASPSFDSNDDGVPDRAGIDVVNLVDPTSAVGDGAADDVNDDGAINAADQLIGAGQVYLILGSNDLPSVVDATNSVSISTLGVGAFRGVVFVGALTGHQLGGGVETKRMKRSFGVGPAGDADGDGRDDLLIGSILADPNGRTDAGESYLIYGFAP
ncbi:MAG: hypothetical protein HOP29_04990 [Phycisphaerales bacterium]|nr:hypothetical protein [Phycisphaerales bacterium]